MSLVRLIVALWAVETISRLIQVLVVLAVLIVTLRAFGLF
jgi:hypothetical protein